MQAPRRESPEVANIELAAELRQEFESLTDFPLDHDLIARGFAQVPRSEVLNHWAQLELHGDEVLGSPTIRIWLSKAFIELPSTPSESCAARLARIEPVLSFFSERGFVVPSMAELLIEYEEQRQRVEWVARLVGGQAPSG